MNIYGRDVDVPKRLKTSSGSINVSNNTPTAGQVLVADSANTATWQAVPGSGSTAALDTSTGTISVNTSTPSAGQILVADSSTVATWQNNVVDLQTAYEGGALITTNVTNNEVIIKRGTAADTDVVLAVQNGAGKDTLTISGGGELLTPKGTLNLGAGVFIGLGAGGVNPPNGSQIAIGENAGQVGQASQAVAVGDQAGQNNQAGLAVAIGQAAGFSSQAGAAVAVGPSAGTSGQKANAVAIGPYAGRFSQGASAIAIGDQAGENSTFSNPQADNSIVINATGVELNNTTASSLKIAPIAAETGNQNLLTYDTTTKEVAYAAVDSSQVGSATLQTAYDGGALITTDGTNNEVIIKRGTANDTDSVLNIQNGVGSITASLTGEGNITTVSGRISDTVFITNGTDGGAGSFIGNSHAVIQRAVDALPSTGGTITIGPGTYSITDKVTISKDVTIVGSGKCIIRSTVVPPIPDQDYFFTIVTGASEVTFQNLIMESATNLTTGWKGFIETELAVDLSVIDCRLDATAVTNQSSTMNAINDAQGTANFTIRNSTIDVRYDTGGVGRLLEKRAPTTNTGTVRISNCRLAFNSLGILLASDNTPIKLFCEQCHFVNDGLSAAIYLDGDADCVITGCLNVTTAYNHTPTSAMTVNYVMSGCGTAGTANATRAFDFTVASGKTLTLNLITDGCDFGDPAVVANSRITGAGTVEGRIQMTDCLNDITWVNSVTTSTGLTQLIEWPDKNRTLSSLSTVSVEAGTTTDTKDYGKVRFDGTSWVQQLARVSTTIYITNGTDGGAGSFIGDTHAVIQRAIDALPSSGGTIFLPAGTFNIGAQITCTKTVRLLGSGMTATLLKTSATPGVDTVVFYITGGIEIMIKDMKLEKDRDKWNRLLDINSSATRYVHCENVHFESNEDTESYTSATDYIVSVALGTAALEDNVYFINCYFHDTYGKGVQCANSDIERLNVTNCTFDIFTVPSLFMSYTLDSFAYISNTSFTRDTRLDIYGGITAHFSSCILPFIEYKTLDRASVVKLYFDSCSRAAYTSRVFNFDILGTSAGTTVDLVTDGCDWGAPAVNSLASDTATNTLTLNVKSTNNRTDWNWTQPTLSGSYTAHIELPTTNRLLSALTGTNWLIGTEAQTTDYAKVRFDGTNWIPQCTSSLANFYLTAADSALTAPTGTSAKVALTNGSGQFYGYFDDDSGTANRIRYTGTTTALVTINVSTSISKDAGGAGTLTIEIARSGTVLDNCQQSRIFAGNDRGSMSLTGTCTLSTNQYLELFWVASGSADYTFESLEANIIVHPIVPTATYP